MIDPCQGPPEAGRNPCEQQVASRRAQCPTNGQAGKPVNTLTLKALLTVPLTRVAPVRYHFCRAVDCSTVYYSSDGAYCFSEIDLRERVFQKHPDDDGVLVCYCFRFTVGDLRAAVANRQAAIVLDTINRGIQAGQCACDIRNPQGSCCLGNVHSAIRRLETAAPGPSAG